MQLDQIFAKDIQRPIEGVIKADDAAHLATEGSVRLWSLPQGTLHY